MGYNINSETMTVECPISLENTTHPKMLKCGHVFDKDNIDKYFTNGKRNCPLCNITI